MNAKKALKIICLVGAGLCVIVFAILWSQGVFSGSSVYAERNEAVEEVLEKTLNERLSEALSKEGIFTDEAVKFLSADTQAAVSAELYPKDQYKSEADVSDDIISKLLSDSSVSITIEIKLAGNRIEFNPYKVIAYQCMHEIYDSLDFKPTKMQLFYYRLPEEGETENVMAYESGIAGIYFDQNQTSVVNQTSLHKIVELDEKLETKAKWYMAFQVIYIVFIALTVIVLTTLLIVRTIKKKKRYKNSKHIDLV